MIRGSKGKMQSRVSRQEKRRKRERAMSLVEGRGLERMGQTKVVSYGKVQLSTFDDSEYPKKASVNAGEVRKKWIKSWEVGRDLVRYLA